MPGACHTSAFPANTVEGKERKDRVDDALHAKRAAIEEGIVPGGGLALLPSLQSLDSLKVDNEDQKVGINIVGRAVQAPALQIAQNAGEDGSVIVGKILEKGIHVGLRCPDRWVCLRTVHTDGLRTLRRRLRTVHTVVAHHTPKMSPQVA